MRYKIKPNQIRQVNTLYLVAISIQCKMFCELIRKIVSNRSISPIDRIVTETTTPGQSRPGSNGKGRVTLHLPKLQN